MYFGLLLIIITIFSICIFETLKYVSNKKWTPLKNHGIVHNNQISFNHRPTRCVMCPIIDYDIISIRSQKTTKGAEGECVCACCRAERAAPRSSSGGSVGGRWSADGWLLAAGHFIKLKHTKSMND